MTVKRYTNTNADDVAALQKSNPLPANTDSLFSGTPTTPTPTPTTPSTGTTGTTPDATTTSDPIADYYNNLASYDPATDDAAIKEQARQQLQSSLDAIDTKYTSLFADETNAGNNRLGQTRAENARSGLLNSDFGDTNTNNTVKTNEQSMAALQAEKQQEIAAVNGQIDQLANQEIAARKSEALDKFQGLEKLQEDARNLIPTVAASGATLTDAQKTALMRQTGYDELTFDTIYNSSKSKAQQGDTTFHTIKKADGSEALLGITINPDGTASQKEYDVQTNGQPVVVYSGRPYIQQTDASGNVHLTPVPGYVTGGSGSGSTKFDKVAETNDADSFFNGNNSGGVAGAGAVRGKDGYVSPQDWALAKQGWVADGGNVDDFYSSFKKYINPADAQDYK